MTLSHLPLLFTDGIKKTFPRLGSVIIFGNPGKIQFLRCSVHIYTVVTMKNDKVCILYKK